MATNYFDCNRQGSVQGEMHVPAHHRKFAREMLEELYLDEREKSNNDILTSKFERFCVLIRNVNYDRHVFFETFQREV